MQPRSLAPRRRPLDEPTELEVGASWAPRRGIARVVPPLALSSSLVRSETIFDGGERGLITQRLERGALASVAPSVQFRTDGHIVAVTACHELLLPFTLDGGRLSLGQLEVPATEPDCTQRERRIDAALAAVLLSADSLVGGLPSDRLTISGPLGEVTLAQPAVQTE